MAISKRLGNDSQILTEFFRRWLFPAMHEQAIDFYSARMLAYNLVQSLGLDPERLYEIEPDTYNGIFEDAEAVTAYIAGIFELD